MRHVTEPKAKDAIVITGLADEIAFRLQTAVLDGEYAPGTRLSQDELCARFGVSRTPVREALRKLQAQNLVELIPNKGATVRIPTRKELDEVYHVRAELEGYATELATPNIGPSELETLRRLQGEISQEISTLATGKVDEAEAAAFNSRMTRANERFHHELHRLAGNDRLRQLIDELQGYFPKDYVWRATRSGADSQALAVDDHDRILTALEAGDGPAARKAMQEHILFARTLLLDYLDDHRFWG